MELFHNVGIAGGGVVADRKHESLDDQIARYQAMSAEEVDHELRKAGIDPAPTIEAVTKLLRAKLAESAQERAAAAAEPMPNRL